MFPKSFRLRAIPRGRDACARRSGACAFFIATLCLTVWAPQAVWAQTRSAGTGTGSGTSTTLERVVVTANRLPQPLSTVLADLSVLGRDEIERSGATAVADLLARLPGVEFARNGGPGTTTGVFIRGSESHHTAVYIDGVRVDSQSTGGAAWEQIPIDQIERIEVLRGPAAAVYGSDAVAGVVQLFTTRGKGAARTTASVSAGSHGSVQAQAGVSGSTVLSDHTPDPTPDRVQGPALDYALSASGGKSAGFDARTSAATGHNPDRDGWQRRAVQGHVGLQLDAAHRVDTSWLASQLQSGYDSSAVADDQNHHTLRTGSLAWTGRWNAQATTRAQLGQTASTYATQPSPYRTETTLRNTTLQHAHRVGQHLWTGTLERREDRLFNPATAFAVDLRGQRHQDALGLGWRGDFGAHGLQAHLRHDDDSEFGGKRTGSLAWGWGFEPDWRVTASTATSMRVPTLFQRFSQYGNAALVPESGRNIELGLRWHAADDEASLPTWRNRVSHLINFGARGPCASASGCYVNVGRAEMKGVSLAGRTQWRTVALRGALDWHDPRNVDSGKVLARRARRQAKVGADVDVGAWTIGSELNAVGMRHDNAANTQRLAGYGLLNLFASTDLRPGLTLDARLDNVGDQDHALARTYATAGRQGRLTLRWATP
jgi:vitamin B12 transporter